MKKNEIHVLMKKPGSAAFTVEVIENSLEGFQKAVGGYIEVHPFNDNLVVVCDEDGRLKKLPYSVTINRINYCGTVVIAATDRSGEFTELEEWMWK